MRRPGIRRPDATGGAGHGPGLIPARAHPGGGERMTRLEEAYAGYLRTLLAAGLILRYDFEPCTLRLGIDHRTTYRPDFRIVRHDGVIEFHEVKGHWRQHDRVKVKVAAEQHPYVFRAAMRDPRNRRLHAAYGWSWETFTPGAPDWHDALP